MSQFNKQIFPLTYLLSEAYLTIQTRFQIPYQVLR